MTTDPNAFEIAPGKPFGPYTIVAMLGAGGMGVVYRARDERLQRDVAVKVIRPPWSSDEMRRRRFEIEARSAARVSHPNVVAIYDIGEIDATPYLVTELLEGGTLGDRISGDPLPRAEALRVAIAVAEALAEAHRQGIIHRDLKPENVLFTRGGVPKISDFGLSKLMEPERTPFSGAATDAALTTEGAIVGTPAYMSPEQASGREIDFRSDQFAFGSVLIEMLTGERPFQRSTSVHTLSAIIDCDLDFERLGRTIPKDLLMTLKRCLAKEPRERYGSTDDLVHDLKQSAAEARPARRRISRAPAIIAVVTVLMLAIGAVLLRMRGHIAPPPHTIESIAILPLSNFSGDHDQDYFAEAMTEELTSQLSSVRSLRVASRTSASAYRGTTKPISTIARELGVDGVIEGSVVRTGNDARVTIQLIDGATDRHVWSQSFDRSGSDVLSLQRDVAREIVGQVRATLSPMERAELARTPTRSVEAYEAYLHAKYKGQTAMTKRADADESLRYAKQAVKLDPQFAEAWVALAKACQAEMFSWGGGKEYDEEAYIAIEKALALNPALAEAYSVRGFLNYNPLHNWDLAAAIADYRKAIAINPNFADAYDSLGAELVHLGLHDEAIRALHTALRLDPGTGGQFQLDEEKFLLARALWQSNRFAEALEVFERYAIVNAEHGVVLAYLGRRDEARSVATASQYPSDTYAALALIDAMERKDAAADEKIRRSFEAGHGNTQFHHAAFLLAAACAEMGRTNDAVRYLDIAANTGMPNYPLFRDNPSMRKLHGKPAYEAFMQALQLRWNQIVATSSPQPSRTAPAPASASR
jgi:serine/threonine protein kinase/tetratricopeptide (TPR) repeat protein